MTLSALHDIRLANGVTPGFGQPVRAAGTSGSAKPPADILRARVAAALKAANEEVQAFRTSHAGD